MQKKTAYKLVPSDKFSRQWKRAKADFERIANRSKPGETKEIKLFGIRFAKYRAGTGIEKRLKSIETLVPKAYTSPASLNKLQTEQALFNSDVVSFVQLLEKTVREAPDGVDKVNLSTGVDHLKNEMHRLVLEVTKEINRLRNALGHTQSFKFAAEQLAKNVRLSLARALVFIDDARQTPTPQEFNDGIQGAARGITQNIGNIDKLRDMGYEFPYGQPDHLFAALTPWANNGRQVDADADAEAVRAEVAHFEVAVHAVADWARQV